MSINTVICFIFSVPEGSYSEAFIRFSEPEVLLRNFPQVRVQILLRYIIEPTVSKHSIYL